MTTKKQGKEKGRRGIQSVGIGLRVLSALAARSGPTSLSTLAEDANLSASQTHRYLSTLMDAGMARQERRSGLYELDAGAIRLGLAALARIDLFTMADETFSRFAAESGRTCLLAIWGDAGPTVVRWFEGNPPVVTSLALGSVLPPLTSATGRVFATFGPSAQIETVGSAWLRQERNLTGDIDKLLEQTRKTGTASVKGDVIPGLRAVAAPVFDLQGRLVLVASALANEGIPESRDKAAAEQLLQACRSLTEALGGMWPIPGKDAEQADISPEISD